MAKFLRNVIILGHSKFHCLHWLPILGYTTVAMGLVFELLGVSPVLEVFQHQTFRQRPQGLAYLSAPEARLDPFLESARQVSPDRGWNVDQAVESVIYYWLRNAETVQRWHLRLLESGRECLLVARLGDEQAYRNDLNALLSD